MASVSETDCLQTYFEQQNDREAASIVAAVMALLPSHTQEEVKDEQEEQKEILEYIDDLTQHVAVLETDLLTKESEIAALKEVASKWRNRVLETESQYHHLQSRYQRKLMSIEKRYRQKLDEKEDMIAYLKDKVDSLIAATDSIGSELSDDESSVYDREKEQGWSSIVDDNQDNSEPGIILGSIQDTMRAIEQELSQHTLRTTAVNEQQPNQQDHTRPIGLERSSDTLVNCPTTAKSSKKKSFMHRMMKKAFPKLCQHNPKKRKVSDYDSECDWPRCSMDQALDVLTMAALAGSNQSCQHPNLAHLSQSQSTVVIT